jgi:cellulose synthase/poly-beta-1,6-N-acetylglucosamine synthase-like glycosyltransferase
MNRADIAAASQIIIMSLFLARLIYFLSSGSYSDKWVIALILITLPFSFMFTLFPIKYLVDNILNIFYPAKKLLEASTYYIPPNNSDSETEEFRYDKRITIQIPIYKEDFNTVIIPTLKSAISISKESQHNIIVCDDGYDCLDITEQTKRISFYTEHDIGWIARSKEGRVGKFKKASNLNFHLNAITMHKLPIQITDSGYVTVPVQTKPISFGGDLSLGDYILIVDADTRFPNDPLCLNRIITLMEEDQKIAIMQFRTHMLRTEQDNCFSQQIGVFTDNLYDMVFPLSTRGGEPSPFVGHNAIIRWTALEKCRQDEQYWKEDKVSEDFDFSLRVQIEGYKTVYCNSLPCFKEGVSYTFHDELLKMSKFAHGSSEIIFSSVFRRYLASSNIFFSSKINLIAYLFSYFAIASSIIVAPLHLSLVCHVKGWDLTVIVLLFSFVLFSIIAPISTIIYKARTKNLIITCSCPSQNLSLCAIIKSQFSMAIFMFMLYCGGGFAMLWGILSHLLGMSISWGSTRKFLTTRDSVSFILWNFRYQYAFIAFFYLPLTVLLNIYVCPSVINTIPMILLIIGHVVNPFLMRGT